MTTFSPTLKPTVVVAVMVTVVPDSDAAVIPTCVVEIAVLVSMRPAALTSAMVRGNWNGKVEVTKVWPAGRSYPLIVRSAPLAERLSRPSEPF